MNPKIDFELKDCLNPGAGPLGVSNSFRPIRALCPRCHTQIDVRLVSVHTPAGTTILFDKAVSVFCNACGWEHWFGASDGGPDEITK